MKKFLGAFLAATMLMFAGPAMATVLWSPPVGDLNYPQLNNNGALNYLDFTGSAPTVTGTGTPTIAAGSTDSAGEVTAGTSATSVVITFAAPTATAPFCVPRSQAQITSFAYTISATAITITQTATSGNLIDYFCVRP